MAYAEKHGPNWRGRYRDADGKKQTAGYANTKRKAEKLAEDEEARIRAGQPLDPTVVTVEVTAPDGYTVRFSGSGAEVAEAARLFIDSPTGRH